MTSDKDILPLARLARLRGTRTVVVGSDRTALPLRRLADEYVTYRDMVRRYGRARAEQPARRAWSHCRGTRAPSCAGPACSASHPRRLPLANRPSRALRRRAGESPTRRCARRPPWSSRARRVRPLRQRWTMRPRSAPSLKVRRRRVGAGADAAAGAEAVATPPWDLREPRSSRWTKGPGRRRRRGRSAHPNRRTSRPDGLPRGAGAAGRSHPVRAP